MLAQSGLSSVEELDAAMRRYELYCENLRDTRTPPTFMEFLGKKSPDPGLFSDIQQIASSRDFANQEELEDEIQRMVAARGSAPVDDFEGLSSSDVHTLLYEPQNSAVFAVNASLNDEAAIAAPVVQQIRWALQYLVDHGGEVRLTQRENFSRQMCESFLRNLAGWWNPGDPVSSESSIPELYFLHELIVLLGYAGASRTKMWITTEGVGILAGKAWSRAFREAFHVVLFEYDWQEWLSPDRRTDHFHFIQQSAIFSLYLLRNQPSGTAGGLAGRFARAFPAFTAPAQDDEGSLDFLRVIYSLLFLFTFCETFGLVDIQGRAPDDYEITDLFRRAFVWKV
jgi:hypothetical protein